MSRHAIIMAGGLGGRLWPMSRRSIPKQFLQLTGDRTLIQQAYDRIRTVIPAEQIWVMTGDQYVSLVQEQLPAVPKKHIIGEPVARNTAPATALAIRRVLAEDPDAVLFGLLPADHYVGNTEVFAQTTQTAFSFIENNPEYVVTIGIRPQNPHTGYGYIKLGKQLDTIGTQTIFKVDSFHEKPSKEIAEQYLASNQYLWNGGYFIFQANEMMDLYRQIAPELLAMVDEYIINPSKESYESIPKEGIDKKIIEHLKHLAVIPAEMNWSDIGDWAALHQMLAAEGETTHVLAGKHFGEKGANNLIMGGNKLIVTVGISNVVVIDTNDVILICHRDTVQDVKKIVEQLEEQGREEYL